MKLKKSLLCLTLLLPLSISACGDRDWSKPYTDTNNWNIQYGNNLAQNYFSNDLKDNFRLKWTRDVHADISSALVTSDYGMTSFSTNAPSGCTFYSLQVSSGRKNFCRIIGPENSIVPTLTDRFGNLYTGALNFVRVFDWYGPIRFNIPVEGNVVAINFLRPNVIIALTDEGQVVIFNAHTGKIYSYTNISTSKNQRFKGPMIVDSKHNRIWALSNNSISAWSINPNFPSEPKIDINSLKEQKQPTSFPNLLEPIWNKDLILPAEAISADSTIDNILLLVDNTFLALNADSGKLSHYLVLNGNYSNISISPSNDMLLSGSSGIMLYKMEFNSLVYKWDMKQTKIISPVIQTPKELITVSNSSDGSAQVLVINKNKGAIISHLDLPIDSQRRINSAKIAVSKNSTLIVAGNQGDVYGLTS